MNLVSLVFGVMAVLMETGPDASAADLKACRVNINRMESGSLKIVLENTSDEPISYIDSLSTSRRVPAFLFFEILGIDEAAQERIEQISLNERESNVISTTDLATIAPKDKVVRIVDGKLIGDLVRDYFVQRPAANTSHTLIRFFITVAADPKLENRISARSPVYPVATVIRWERK